MFLVILVTKLDLGTAPHVLTDIAFLLVAIVSQIALLENTGVNFSFNFSLDFFVI